MLIIVSGVQTLNIRSIANEVFFGLNKFKVDDYEVTFRSRTFKIDDSSGATVYSASFPGVENTTTLLHTEGGSATFDKVQSLLHELLAETDSWHFSSKFAEDVLVDFGCEVIPQSEQSWPGAFEGLIEQYKASPHDTVVISGSFSKRIIDRISQEIGSENVVAINIVRNPSAAYLCNLRSPEFYAEYPGEYGNHLKRLQLSLVSATGLKLNQVETIKFEDILANKMLTVNGTDIHVPDELILLNDNITVFEISTIQARSDELDAALSEFNDVIADFNNRCFLDGAVAGELLTNKIKELIPKNIFTSLGYSPLTYEQVTAKL